ncbi:MAG: APC family permease [Gemmatimonadaceae bacterium]
MATEPAATPAHAASLTKAMGGVQLFALGFGGIVGAGWVVALGGWLNEAGPLGAIVAFALGGIAISLVGLCYAEMTMALPRSGGEVVYAYELFGLRTCFAMGWCLTLAYIATTVFEALSVAWLVDALLPWTLGPTLYTVAGEPVRAGTLALGLGGTVVITYINYRGVRPASAAQDVFTYLKIAIAAVFVVAGLVWGSADNLEPLFAGSGRGGAAQWGGIAAVMTTAPFWFGGFNTIAQVMEEKAPRTSLRVAGRMIVLSIVAAAVFYCLVILSASMVVPWRRLVTAELPVAGAFETAFGSPVLAKLVLVAALLGILTVWNGVAIAASRVLYALGRASIISPAFGRVHPRYGSPATAVVVSGIISGVGVLLGRAAIGPVVNVASTCFALGYLLVCAGLLRLRRTRPDLDRPYRVPGGAVTIPAAALTAAGMVVLSLHGPLAGAARGIPLEWWVLVAWVVLGAAFWVVTRALRGRVSEAERRALIAGAGAAPR